ncbi:MAG: alpha/beta hydrolase [Pseudomonadota bacterium]
MAEEVQHQYAKLATEAGDIRVHFSSYGHGSTSILLLHGLACDESTWEAQIGLLSQRARVVSLDFPGHGKSEKPDSALTIDVLVYSVHAVLAAAKIERAVLVGHSMGELVSRHFYARFPELVTAYVSIDGLVYYRKWPLSMRVLSLMFRTPLYDLLWRRLVGGMTCSDTSQETVEKVESLMLSADRSVVRQLIKCISESSESLNQRINVPVLALNAGEFDYSSPDLTEKIKSIANHADRFVVPEVGHFLMMEKPDIVNSYILKFIEDVIGSKED